MRVEAKRSFLACNLKWDSRKSFECGVKLFGIDQNQHGRLNLAVILLRKSRKHREFPEPYETLFRIQRALTGYISYLAACETNVVFSEYLLYEPILRVLLARKFEFECESSCEDFLPREGKQGEHKRIDFVAERPCRFALEVKWHDDDTGRLVVDRDYEKLAAFQKHYPDTKTFLCVFGRYSQIDVLKLTPNSFSQVGFKDLEDRESELGPIYAPFIRTQFGCKLYVLCQNDQIVAPNVAKAEEACADALNSAPGSSLSGDGGMIGSVGS